MPLAIRIGLVVLGVGMAVYGAASLTGGWLGTPPWWERHDDVEIWVSLRETDGLRAATTPEKVRLDLVTEREGRARVSMLVIAVGLVLVAVGAWPRRRA